MYEPTEADLHWARQVIALIPNKGMWIAPSTMLAYQFDHVAKTMTMVSPVELLDLSFEAFVTHEQTKAVFGKIEYEMKGERK